MVFFVLFYFVFLIYSLSWKFWPRLACEYASFAVLVSVFDLTLNKGQIKSSSCGFRADIALFRKVFGSWSEFHYITFIVCTKNKSLKEMERIH